MGDDCRVLFDMPRPRKREYWKFMKLVAPASELPEDKTAWESKDAVSAYCLRCEKTIIYRHGNSNSIRTHMKSQHKIHLREYERENTIIITP